MKQNNLMKNTGTEYLSTERTPTVLPELSELLPPLTDEQFSSLEADILQNGCYSPIITNEDLVVVDGHNRMDICEEHGIPYRIAVFHFEDMLEAKQWALNTQKGRRNLDTWELGQIALKLKPDIEARAAASHAANGGDKKSGDAKSACTIGDTPISDKVNTAQELADSVGIGRNTMNKVMQIDEKAPDTVKKALDKGFTYLAYGEEGKDWMLDGNAIKPLREPDSSGKKLFNEQSALGSMRWLACWFLEDKHGTVDPNTTDWDITVDKKLFNNYGPYAQPASFTKYLATPLFAKFNIDQYSSDEFTKIIMDSSSFDDKWNAFVKSLYDQYGAQAVIEEVNAEAAKMGVNPPSN